jgi:hypothetical protein
MMALRVKITPKLKSEAEPPAATDDDEPTPTERGLLKVAGNQKQQIGLLNAQIRYLHKSFIISGLDNGSVTEDDVWEYLLLCPLWVLTSSRCYNVKSTVAWYENKNGERFKAHYSKHKNYLRRMKAGEDGGIYYNGQFTITPESHKIKSDVSTAKLLEDCFEPIFPLEK